MIWRPPKKNLERALWHKVRQESLSRVISKLLLGVSFRTGRGREVFFSDFFAILGPRGLGGPVARRRILNQRLSKMLGIEPPWEATEAFCEKEFWITASLLRMLTQQPTRAHV